MRHWDEKCRYFGEMAKLVNYHAVYINKVIIKFLPYILASVQLINTYSRDWALGTQESFIVNCDATMPYLGLPPPPPLHTCMFKLVDYPS